MTENEIPKEFFISYSRADQEDADDFCEKLSAAGLIPWIDRKGILGGKEWTETISQAVNRTNGMILLISENSMDSRNVAREVLLAHEKGKTILPIILREATIPEVLELPLVGRQRLQVSNFELIVQSLNSIENSKTVKSSELIAVHEVDELRSPLVGRVKRYLTDERFDIDLHDMLSSAAKGVADRLLDFNAKERQNHLVENQIVQRVKFYEEQVADLRDALIAGAFWGKPRHASLWVKVFKIAAGSLSGTGSQAAVVPLKLQLYPLMYLWYNFGIASLSNEQFGTLGKTISTFEFNVEPFTKPVRCYKLQASEVFYGENARLLNENKQFFFPMSEYLFSSLRRHHEDYVTSLWDFEHAFNLFELLISIGANMSTQARDYYVNDLGRFAYQTRTDNGKKLFEEVSSDLEKGAESVYIKTGIIPPNIEVAKSSYKQILEYCVQRYF